MSKYSELFTDPEWFLAAFDADNAQFSFIKTSLPTLRNAPFHDGRSNLSVNGATTKVSLDEAMSWQQSQLVTATPNRLLIHVSFCGSTLLAKALGVDGRNLAYQEPQVLIDLANLKAGRHAISLLGNVWNHILSFSFGQFKKHWTDQRAAFVKPSNWANNIVPDALNTPSPSRCVIIDFDIESYLVANLRGGQKRLGYSLELLNHLARQNQSDKVLAERVERMPLSPIQKVLHLLTITFDAQQRCLTEIAGRADSVFWLSKKQLLRSPRESLANVADALNIEFEASGTRPQLATLFKTNAKAEAPLEFSLREESARNSYVLTEFGGDISQAIQWYQATLI